MARRLYLIAWIGYRLRGVGGRASSEGWIGVFSFIMSASRYVVHIPFHESRLEIRRRSVLVLC